MKLPVDQKLIQECQGIGKTIAQGALEETANFTSLSVERATLRVLGEPGGDNGVNALVDRDEERAKGQTQHYDASHIRLCMENLENITRTRQDMREGYDSPPTLRYVLTATGDVDHDVTHALAVAEAGGDIIAVIRSTAQSLLDYVPEGETHEGYGGTFATQANFRKIREALDDWTEKNGRYVRLSSFCSGLCMPEIAVIAAMEGLDNIVNDGMYGILYRDINPIRTIVDQRFSRMVNGWAGIVINTGEDNYPRTADPMECMPSVIASWFINYALARAAGIPDQQIALGLAFEVDPDTYCSLGYEIAHAALLRELWPDCPVKYMPPTRYMNGDLWRTQTTDTLFNLVTELTRPGIQTIGVPTEGIFTPHIQDRVISMGSVNQVARASHMLDLGLNINPDGWIADYARTLLKRSWKLLEDIADAGLFVAIANGTFGDVKRPKDAGRGLDGVITKDWLYSNPVEEWIGLY